MEDALESGAEDFITDDDVYEIYTQPDDLDAVKDALVALGYTLESAEKDKIPSSYIKLENEDDIRKMNLLLENLEENDDVGDVYHNWEE